MLSRNDSIIVDNTHLSAVDNLNLKNKNFYYLIKDKYISYLEQKSKNTNDIAGYSNILMIQQAYLDLFNSKEKILIGDVLISFADNNWNFTVKYMEGKQANLYKYNFNSKYPLSDYLITLLKLFVFYNITDYGIHCGTNKNKFLMVKKLFEFMTAEGISLVEDLRVSDLEEFFSEQDISYSTFIKCRRHIECFLKFYSIIAKDVYSKELVGWFQDIDTTALQATIEERKTPLLPSSFYKDYCNLLYDSVMDANEDRWIRGYLGLLFIGTQTGLRTGELVILRVQDLHVHHYKKRIFAELHYRSTKSIHSKAKKYDIGITNAPKKVVEVYSVLEELFKEERKNYNLDLLVPRRITLKYSSYDNGFRKHIGKEALNTYNMKFCLKHHKKFGLINTKDSASFCGEFIINNKRNIYFTKNELNQAEVIEGDVFSYPIIRQFRVYVGSEYRERGVDDRTLAHLYNHHCVEMYGYYVRPKNEIQEDIIFSQEIIKDIVIDQTKILGPKGEAFERKIDEIIKENNFNVEKDIDAIIDKVCGEIPIRAKKGGFCIKSNPRRECRHDAKTDELMCAYGCCPNHCHMYFMLPFSYSKAKQLYKIVKYNQESGYINATQKEAFKLIHTINNELIPEFNETKKELQKRSKLEIITAHPEMEKIINALDKIEEEISAWKIELTKI